MAPQCPRSCDFNLAHIVVIFNHPENYEVNGVAAIAVCMGGVFASTSAWETRCRSPGGVLLEGHVEWSNA